MRLIDADEFCRIWDGCTISGSFKPLFDARPTIDAVPVVRCKDCVHYMPYDWMFSEVRQSQNIEDYPQNEIGCEWVDHNVKPDDYCSYGEPKA